MPNFTFSRNNISEIKEYLFSANSKYNEIGKTTPNGTVVQYYGVENGTARKHILKKGGIIISHLEPSPNANRIGKPSLIRELFPGGMIFSIMRNDGSRHILVNSFSSSLVSFDSGTKQYKINGVVVDFAYGKKIFDSLSKFIRGILKK